MNYTARLNRLKKETEKNKNRPIRIKVAHYTGNNKSWHRDCELYYAKKRLNLLEPGSPKKIYTGLTDEQRERYASLTIEEATGILRESEK